MPDEKMMPDEKRPGLPRRKFLSDSAKLLTGAAAPLLIAPRSCNEQKEECLPSAKGGGSRQPAGDAYDVIVIGSGFGATVAVTSLLSRKPGLKVLILERGLWWLSPDRPKPSYLARKESERVQYYVRPDHNDGVRYLLSILAINGARLRSKNEPLYNMHTFRDMNVLTASGVGGGSLIYLNVTIPPIKDESGAYPIFKDWPLQLTEADYTAALNWMALWRGRLSRIVTEFPLRPGLDPSNLGDKENLYLSKSRALRHAANVTGNWEQKSPWTPAPLSIDEYDESNPDVTAKRELEVCTRIGRCFLGCTPRAIQTLDKTLLEKFLNDPRKYPGLKLESLKEVSHIQQASDGTYNVYFQNRSAGRGDQFSAYNARQVIVAAGTLGTNEILLRSHLCEKTLNLSDRLGYGFSGNGDLGGFILDVGQRYPPGTGEAQKLGFNVYPTRGPNITSYVQFESDGGAVQMTVEDGGIPPTLAAFTKVLLNFAGRPAASGIESVFNKLRELDDSGQLPKLEPILRGSPRPSDPASYQTEQEMLENVFYFQCMGTDKPDGQFFLDRKGRLDLKYGSNPREQPVFKRLEEIMRAMAVKMGGRFVPFPSMLLSNPRLFTLHPLGGCRMGRDVTEGVIDTKGRVFKKGGADPQSVYEGLYVMDASALPGPVAVNPTLTIVALALRIAENIPV